MRHVAIVAGVVHGRVHETVDVHGAGCLVDFVLHRVAVRGDLDDHIDIVGHIAARIDAVQVHNGAASAQRSRAGSIHRPFIRFF